MLGQFSEWSAQATDDDLTVPIKTDIRTHNAQMGQTNNSCLSVCDYDCDCGCVGAQSRRHGTLVSACRRLISLIIVHNRLALWRVMRAKTQLKVEREQIMQSTVRLSAYLALVSMTWISAIEVVD
jgi:hypothetical protein